MRDILCCSLYLIVMHVRLSGIEYIRLAVLCEVPVVQESGLPGPDRKMILTCLKISDLSVLGRGGVGWLS